MATAPQIAADCLNLTKSDQDRDAPRGNALMLGVCAAALVPDVERQAVERSLAEWRPHYTLATPEHRAALEQMVISSLRLEQCRAQEAALRHCERARATLRWDQERRAEADALGKGLARRPAVVARQLEQTRQGADWMIERWQMLGLLLEEQKGEWTRAQTAMALDLTGTPRELRLKAPVFDRAALVAGEVARLERLKAESLDAMDELERDLAGAGTPTTPSAAIRELRRHEAACLREYHRAARNSARRRVATPPPAPAPGPAPTPTPEPAAAPAEEQARRDPEQPAPAAAPDPTPASGPTRRIKPPYMSDAEWNMLQARYIYEANHRWNYGY